MSNQPPVFGTASLLQVAENQLKVGTLSATDDVNAVGAGLTFSIVGGVDAGQFVVDNATGVLSFATASDFENPTDSGANNVYDLTVRVTDSGGLYADKAIAVQVTDLKTLEIVLTMGQSLSVGTTATAQVLNTTPLYPATILGMDYGSVVPMNIGWRNKQVGITAFKGFAPLKETGTETHDSGMMNEIVSQYVANGLTPPTFLHINAGDGGRSILQLMTGGEHIYQSVSDALLHESNGSEFAIDKLNGTFDFYINNAGTAQFYQNWAGALTDFDNLVIQLQTAVDYGRTHGYEIAPTLIFNWMQGQSDSSMRVANTGYGYLLNQLIDRVTSVVHSVVGTDANVLTVVSQIRDNGGSWVPIDQLSEVIARPDVIFGAPEYQFEAEYPSKATSPGMDFTHLSPTGYYMYGQTIGKKVFAALTGHEDTPILIDNVLQTSATSVIVHFSGVNTYLVDDPSFYSAANGLHAPANLGFGLYNAAGTAVTLFKIASATITGADTVRLDFTAPITGAFRLYLGRSEDALQVGGGLPKYGGSSLRDASATPALQPTGGAVLADPFIYEYAPVQYTLVAANTAPVLLTAPGLSVPENVSLVADLAVTDDKSTEGNGIVYAITGGADAALFTLDSVTGVLAFKTAPNFESPGSAAHTNSYALTIAVSDPLGAKNSYSLTVAVKDVAEAPTNFSTAGLSVYENDWTGSTVGYVTASDQDIGDKLTYALLNSYGGAFAIDPATGKVTLASAGLLTGLGGQTLSLPFSVTDSTGLSVTKNFDVTVSASSTNIFHGTTGDDIIQSNGFAPLRVDSDAGNDRLTGGSFDDTLLAGAGDDWLAGLGGADYLDGGTGFDTISYATSLAAVQVNLLTGLGTGGEAQGDRLFNIEKVIGSAFNDTLTGDNGDNVLQGGAGNDILDGLGGIDTADYSDALARVTVSLMLTAAQNTAGSGTDTLRNIENLVGSAFADVLTGNGLANVLNGGAGDDTLSGGGGNDTLIGGDGIDRLDGGIGADLMIGGAGNDTYTVDDIGDVIDETDGSGGDAGGVDLVNSAITFSLAGLAYVENLTLTGTAAIDGTGNDLANAINGNAAANVLDGGNGNDTLNGNAGADTLIGGAGNDFLIGGADNDKLYGGAGSDRLDGGIGADYMAGGADGDTYIVDNIGDVVDETNGFGLDAGGVDTVNSSVSYVLGGLAFSVENLTLTGTAAIDATGNDLPNLLMGNAAANVLDGGLGNDVLNGGAGNDTLIGGAGADKLTGGADSDTFVFAPGFGKDIISDFTAGAVGQDFIKLSLGTAFDTYAEVMAVAKASGNTTVFTFNANDTITLLGVIPSQLLPQHFVFG